jgi:hypothetical protein
LIKRRKKNEEESFRPNEQRRDYVNLAACLTRQCDEKNEEEYVITITVHINPTYR